VGHQPLGAAVARPNDVVGQRRGVGWVEADSRHQPPAPCGHRWLTGRGALRYSLAVRARPRAVWVRLGPRDPLGGGTAPSTYDLTR